MVNMAICEGVVSIVEKKENRFEMSVNDLDIMVHCKDTHQIKKIKTGDKAKCYGRCCK